MAWKEKTVRIHTWEEESEITGTFVKQELFDKGKLGDCQVYFVDFEGGGMVSFVCGSAFDKQFTEAKIEVGDVIKICYDGKKDIGSGKKVNLFRLYKDED